MKQKTFASMAYEKKKRQTRRERFLAEMEQVVPWAELVAVIEPHYRLPFLSWLPIPVASAYLRLSGRGHAYEGIRFMTYGPLHRMMSQAGFAVHDITEQAIDELLERTWGQPWTYFWKRLGSLPARIRSRLLRLASPQWFFLLEKPAPDRRHGQASGDAGRSAE